MTGSGTPMAVLAAGRVHGVAKEASVYAVQAHWRYKRAEDEEEIESTGLWAMNEAYNRVMAVVLERGLQGKAVVVVSRGKSSLRLPYLHSYNYALPVYPQS